MMNDNLYQQNFMRDRNRNCIMALPMYTHIPDLDKIVTQFFEDYNGESVYTVSKEVIKSLRGDGIYVNIGSYYTSALCVFDNVYVKSDKTFLGGDHINNYLMEIWKEKGFKTVNLNNLDINEIKEQACYISTNFMRDLQTSQRLQPKSIQTKKKGSFQLDHEQFLAPELLFLPSLNNITERSIVKLIIDLYNALPHDIRSHSKTIYLSGGTSLLKNLPERLEQELNNTTNHNFKVQNNELSNGESTLLTHLNSETYMPKNQIYPYFFTKQQYQEGVTPHRYMNRLFFTENEL